MPESNNKNTVMNGSESAVIEISDESVGLDKFSHLNDRIIEEMKGGTKSFKFDLSKLNSINSSGLGILISCLKKIKDSGGSLEVINLNEKILNIFKLTKLDNVFDLK